MKHIRKIWDDIRQGENLDLYLTVLAALVLAALNLFGIVSQGLSTSVSLATLAILTAAMLGNRHRIESILKKVGSSSTPPLRMRGELAPLLETAQDVNDILIVGVSGAVVLRQTDFFVNSLRQGATVRVAVANPENDAIIDATSPLTGISRNGLVADMQTAHSLAYVIKEQAGKSERFQVRLFNYAPTLAFVMLDGDRPTGRIVVELRPYQVSSSSRCHLFVTAKEHPEWFTYFRDVCESIWRDAAPL